MTPHYMKFNIFLAWNLTRNLMQYKCFMLDNIFPISLISLNPKSMTKMQFCPKEATLSKLSQHRLTLLRSSNSWKKFLTLRSITLYAFVQIHSLTLPSLKTTSQASSIVRIFRSGNAIPNFFNLSSGDVPLSLVVWLQISFSKSLAFRPGLSLRQDQTSQTNTLDSLVGLSSKLQTSLRHQYFQEEV